MGDLGGTLSAATLTGKVQLRVSGRDCLCSVEECLDEAYGPHPRRSIRTVLVRVSSQGLVLGGTDSIMNVFTVSVGEYVGLASIAGGIRDVYPGP